MVWGSISGDGPGPLRRISGNLNSRGYVTLLRDVMSDDIFHSDITLFMTTLRRIELQSLQGLKISCVHLGSQSSISHHYRLICM